MAIFEEDLSVRKKSTLHRKISFGFFFWLGRIFIAKNMRKSNFSEASLKTQRTKKDLAANFFLEILH